MTSSRIRIWASAALATLATASAWALSASSGDGLYATDAYPGFDRTDSDVRPEKKEPRWFRWISGPKMTNATEQLAWARACVTNGACGKASRAYDALVREWPMAPEAPVAQLELARLYLGALDDSENAFQEYRYLLDFYAPRIDARQIAREMFETVKRMREEGRKIVFFRLKSPTDARRAFESVVRRVPGADFAPEALFAVAELREEEHDLENAIRVYENLINLHPLSPEGRRAVYRAAKDRMAELHDHPYNRTRCRMTIHALESALTARLEPKEREAILKWIAEARAMQDDESYRAARFYDSKTRPKLGAIGAYENFLSEHPTSARAAEVRARLSELRAAADSKGAGK